MNKLIFANLLHRPLRSVISVLAVAIEVIMILSIVAIMVGQIQGAANQYSCDFEWPNAPLEGCTRWVRHRVEGFASVLISP